MTETLVLEHLRHLRAQMDSMNEKIDLFTVSVGSLEQSTAQLHVDLAVINQRLDRQEKRLDRIEKRLDLREAGHE